MGEAGGDELGIDLLFDGSDECALGVGTKLVVYDFQLWHS